MTTSVFPSTPRSPSISSARIPEAQHTTWQPTSANWGTTTYILGSVGKEDHGEEYLRNLRIHGAITKYVTLKEGLTGMSLVFLYNGEKTVLTSRGANALLGEEDLNPEVFDKIDTMVLTSLISQRIWR